MHFHQGLAGPARAVLVLWPVLLLVAACAETAGDSVDGRMLHTAETFTGKSTAPIDGEGALSLVSNTGTRCSGPYRQVREDNGAEVGTAQRENGVATLTCNDGRTGSVMFLVGADQAIGTGMLGTDILTVTIGQ